MSMEGAEHPEEFVTQFALDQGSVGEYLISEVLDRQSDQVRTLLIETSFLPEINAELAEAVTGFSGAGEALSDLSRTNAFVVPLDRKSQRFRYHQLLREILRYQLRRVPLQRRHELSERAAQWYRQRGQISEPLRLAVDGQNWAQVTVLLVHGGLAQAFIDHVDLSFVRAADLTPDAGVDPGELSLARAALLATTGQPAAARHELNEARQAHVPVDRDASLTVALVDFIIARSEHRIGALDSLARAVTEQSRDDHALAALPAAVMFEQGCAQFWAGNYDATERLLTDAVRRARGAGDIPLELRSVAQLTLVNAYWGRFRTSQQDEARAKLLLHGNPGLATPSSLHLAASIRAYYQADHETSLQALRDAEATLDAELPIALPIMRGLLLASSGAFEPARAALSAPSEAPRGGLSEDVRVTTLADIDTTLGCPNAALRRLRAHATSPASAATCVSMSRALLALGELRRAADSLVPVLAGGDSYAPRGLVVEALIARAQVALAAHDEGRAVESLVRACELASNDIAYPFTRAAEDFRGLLARHSSLAALWPNTGPARELRAVPKQRSQPRSLLPEPLTDREQMILGSLSTQMSTAEIADELRVSVNTVKTHIAAIYRKLHADRRRDAVSRARTLELI
jgi:LuxR family maltose regulon positive regulatory protein